MGGRGGKGVQGLACRPRARAEGPHGSPSFCAYVCANCSVRNAHPSAAARKRDVALLRGKQILLLFPSLVLLLPLPLPLSFPLRRSRPFPAPLPPAVAPTRESMLLMYFSERNPWMMLFTSAMMLCAAQHRVGGGAHSGMRPGGRENLKMKSGGRGHCRDEAINLHPH